MYMGKKKELKVKKKNTFIIDTTDWGVMSYGLEKYFLLLSKINTLTR